MSASPPLPGTPVRLLPLAPAPFAVCLLRREAAGAAPAAPAAKAGRATQAVTPGKDPFLRAGREDDGSRAYAALLTSDTGAVLAPLVVELPSGEGEEPVFPGEEPPSNTAVEAAWEAARRDLLRLLAEPDCFPELVLPVAADGEPPFLPPLFFCPAADRLFPIPCPRCLGALRTCRDEARLAAAGLPSYGATTARFLHCRACAGDPDASPRFWAGSVAEARGLGEAVGSLDDLRRELAAAGRKGGDPRLPDTPPAGWIAWNVHDSPYLVTRMASLRLDAFLERLGGSLPESTRPGEPKEPEAPGLLFAAEGSGIDAVEVLALKLAAFL
ncbi:MAG TPA: hypothetical protein VGR07_05740, partial [Thermoanaerobaculia bacterium]|nr:hypothetical protein [Thermoanaerobaculia bacterium]